MATPPSWKQSDIFPRIADVVAAQFQQHQRFITSREIADALLHDAEARRVIDSVVQQRGGSPQRTAINMVAWFSQRITAQQSEWHRMFERTRINNQYAYKPLSKADEQQRDT